MNERRAWNTIKRFCSECWMNGRWNIFSATCFRHIDNSISNLWATQSIDWDSSNLDCVSFLFNCAADTNYVIIFVPLCLKIFFVKAKSLVRSFIHDIFFHRPSFCVARDNRRTADSTHWKLLRRQTHESWTFAFRACGMIGHEWNDLSINSHQWPREVFPRAYNLFTNDGTFHLLWPS